MRWCSKFIVVALTGCSSQLPADGESTSAGDESALRSIVAKYETAWNASDQMAFRQLFVEEASQYLERHPPAHGVAEISLNAVSARETERRTRCFHPITLVARGDLGYVIGTYAFDKSGIDTGGFVMTLRRSVQGNWCVSSMLENSCDPIRETPVELALKQHAK
jgi:hypothetical protein